MFEQTEVRSLKNVLREIVATSEQMIGDEFEATPEVLELMNAARRFQKAMHPVQHQILERATTTGT